MNFWSLGSFMYLQRQGLCSLSFEQHTALGEVLEDVIAVAQGLSCKGLHVTASVTSTFDAPRTNTSNIAQIAMLLIAMLFGWP